MENGANINEETINDLTPLFIACENGHENIIKYLVEHGANINCEAYNVIKKNFYSHSIFSSDKESKNYLNNRNKYGITPLLIALESWHENIVKYLVEHGAIINNLYINDIILLINACKNGHFTTVK